MTEQIRFVLALCWAGSDRSRLIAEELNRRGYVASHGGVSGSHPTNPDEIASNQAIIFSDATIRETFFKNTYLSNAVTPSTLLNTMHITELDKERVFQGHGCMSLEELQEHIEWQLDQLGFIDINNIPWESQ